MGAEWTPDLILNHELLDAQHVEIFRRLAEAGAALDADRATLGRAVSAFVDALLEHFATEERLMEETLYSERARHRSAHELFLADVTRVREGLAGTGRTPEVDAWLRERLPEWLRFHTRVNDARFGEFLARRRPRPLPNGRAARPAGGRLS
jgi:hemerythrin